ncbi:hypothetical protein FS749_014018 [Ceratobasidium sp. UAMH 11750]|nr:hypothetical protein FS749_014018 [Ceratobasidium sp. UAMH 11750]
MASASSDCTVYFKKNGTFASIHIQDPTGDKTFTFASAEPDDTSVHGIVLFGRNQPAQFVGSQTYIVRSSAWKTVVLVGNTIQTAIVVVIDNFNVENSRLDYGTGMWDIKPPAPPPPRRRSRICLDIQFEVDFVIHM